MIFETRSEKFHTDRTLHFFLDVDECKDIAFICGLDGICINKNGSYDCVCPEGQKPNPKDKRCEGKLLCWTASKTLIRYLHLVSTLIFFSYSQTCDNNNVSWTWKARRLPIQFVRASFQRTWHGMTVVAPEWVWHTALSVNCAPREKQVRFNIKILLADLYRCPMAQVRRI